MYMSFTWHIDAAEPLDGQILLEALDCFGRRQLRGCSLGDNTMLFGLPDEICFNEIASDLSQVAQNYNAFEYVLIGNLLHDWYLRSARFPQAFEQRIARAII